MNEEIGLHEQIEQPPVLFDNNPTTTDDPWAAWRGFDSSENPVLEALAETERFMGIQEIGKWVYLMKAKYNNEEYNKDIDDLTPFGQKLPYLEMSLIIDKAAVGELQMMHLNEWKEEAIRRLLAEAEVLLMKDDAMFQIRKIGSKIAKDTRRGKGNVIIATTGALKNLDMGEKLYGEKPYQIIEVPKGYAGINEDFAMIGYKGSNKCDTSLVLSLAPKPMKSGKYFGSIVSENIKQYWKRII